MLEVEDSTKTDDRRDLLRLSVPGVNRLFVSNANSIFSNKSNKSMRRGLGQQPFHVQAVPKCTAAFSTS